MDSKISKAAFGWPFLITTGKSIEIDRRSCAQGLLEVSALSVVVNAQADALIILQRQWLLSGSLEK